VFLFVCYVMMRMHVFIIYHLSQLKEYAGLQWIDKKKMINEKKGEKAREREREIIDIYNNNNNNMFRGN